MPERRFPRPDADFAAYIANYYEAVEKWWTINGFDKNDLRPLGEALTAWLAAYPAHITAQAAAEAARQTKDAARVGLEKQARLITAFIQSNSKTTDADRATMGITIRNTGGTPVPQPTSRPLVLVDVAARYTHRLRVLDAAPGRAPGRGPDSRATKRARPRGVERAELFVAFTPTGTPPPEPPPPGSGSSSTYRYVQSVSDGSTVLSFDSPQGGMQAHYLARWVTRRGAIGPWSDTASATVAA